MTHQEKESIATALISMLKEASKNVVNAVNGIYKAEIGRKMQILDKGLNHEIKKYFIHTIYF